MSNIDNGILQRFMIVAGACHRHLWAEQDGADGDIKNGHLSLKMIYNSLLNYGRDIDSNFYLRFVLSMHISLLLLNSLQQLILIILRLSLKLFKKVITQPFGLENKYKIYSSQEGGTLGLKIVYSGSRVATFSTRYTKGPSYQFGSGRG